MTPTRTQRAVGEPLAFARARSAMPTICYSMKLVCVAAIAIATAVVALPTHAEQYKIGVMNVEKILRQSKAAQAAQARIEQEFKARDAEISRKEQDVQAAGAQLAKDRPKLSADEATRRDRDLDLRTREVQRQRQQFAEDLRARQFEELDKLKARLDQVLTKYAKDNHFDLILQDAAFVGHAVNISDVLINALEPAPEK